MDASVVFVAQYKLRLSPKSRLILHNRVEEHLQKLLMEEIVISDHKIKHLALLDLLSDIVSIDWHKAKPLHLEQFVNDALINRVKWLLAHRQALRHDRGQLKHV